MFGWCWAHMVKFKSPQNAFARRFRGVERVVYCVERHSWCVFWKTGKKAEIPGEHVVIFGRKVIVAY